MGQILTSLRKVATNAGVEQEKEGDLAPKFHSLLHFATEKEKQNEKIQRQCLFAALQSDVDVLNGDKIAKDYINHGEASRKWLNITGDSKVIGFREVTGKGVIDAVVETCKYLTKFSKGQSSAEIITLACALRNR